MSEADFDARLKNLVEMALQEDVGDGDHSTLSSIPPEQEGFAELKLKQTGILAGMAVAEKIFRMVEPSVSFVAYKNDGDTMNYGDKAFEVGATVHTILKTERLVLNIMQRMSGIATLTRQYTDKIQGYKTRLLDTRKTTPNFRLLEKEAVRIGGAYNHRFGLYDMIMLKDNHIEYCGGIAKAVEKAYAYVQRVKPGMLIEVETRNLSEVEQAVGTGKVDRIMLDNFSPYLITQALTIINGRCATEASGGINLDTIEAYARTGVDFVSVGGLIHQARSLDMSLKAKVI